MRRQEGIHVRDTMNRTDSYEGMKAAERQGRQAVPSIDCTRSATQSQYKLASDVLMCAERGRSVTL